VLYKDLEATAEKLMELAVSGAPANKAFERLIGEKADKVLEVVYKAKFIKTKNMTLVLMPDRNYIIYDFYYCSCYDFYMKNLVRHSNQPCKHLLALTYKKTSKNP